MDGPQFQTLVRELVSRRIPGPSGIVGQTYGLRLGNVVGAPQLRDGIWCQQFASGAIVETASAVQALFADLATAYLQLLEDGTHPGRPSTKVYQAQVGLRMWHLFTEHGCLRYAAPGVPETFPGWHFDRLPRTAEDTPLNNLRWLSAHNAYESPARDAVDLAPILRLGVRSLELDLHIQSGFRIAHSSEPGRPLADYIGELAAWVRGHPDADIVTVWMELKDDWHGHDPVELDALLSGRLGDVLFTPENLAEQVAGTWMMPLLAVRHGGWPTRAALRGKVMVVVNGNFGRTTTYWRAPGQLPRPLAFVAMDDHLMGSVTSLRDERFAFYNIRLPWATGFGCALLAYIAWFNGAITRIWQARSPGEWQYARNVYSHHIALNILPEAVLPGPPPSVFVDTFVDPVSGAQAITLPRGGVGAFPYVREMPTTADPHLFQRLELRGALDDLEAY